MTSARVSLPFHGKGPLEFGWLAHLDFRDNGLIIFFSHRKGIVLWISTYLFFCVPFYTRSGTLFYIRSGRLKRLIYYLLYVVYIKAWQNLTGINSVNFPIQSLFETVTSTNCLSELLYFFFPSFTYFFKSSFYICSGLFYLLGIIACVIEVPRFIY